MFFNPKFTKREKAKRDGSIAALQAITTNDYETYRPMVLAAVHKVGPIVWQWLDEGPGYSTMGGNAFARLRTVRNSDTRALFAAINAKR